MFGKVKKWLGIEGVKVELSIPEEVLEQQEVISGTVQFYSMNTQTVNSVKVIITEKYYRGRRKKKMIDEYKIGEILMENQFEVPAEEMLEIDFELPFTVIKSQMDKLQGSNFLFKGIIGAAKKLKGVRSVYTVTAEAEVDGTKLHPFDKREILIK